MTSRTLRDCFNAKVFGDEIRCVKGHKLGQKGTIKTLKLKRDAPMIYSVCQSCPHVDSFEEPWVKED